MKSKFLLLFVLFLAIGLASFAQTATTSSDVKKDTPAQTTVDQSKTDACVGHGTATKADCKWVDTNKDGKCDTCGKTTEECKEKSATTTGSKCNPAACGSKDATKAGGCCPGKSGKK